MGEEFSGADPQALRLAASRVAMVARDLAALAGLAARRAAEAPAAGEPRLAEAIEVLAARCSGALSGASERLARQASELRSAATATEEATASRQSWRSWHG